MLPLCAEHGLGFTPFRPLAGGWLTGKYRRGAPAPAGSRMTLRPEPYLHLDDDRVHAGLERLAERGDPATLAFAWLYTQPQVTAVVVGPRRPEHLEPALAALGSTSTGTNWPDCSRSCVSRVASSIPSAPLRRGALSADHSLADASLAEADVDHDLGARADQRRERAALVGGPRRLGEDVGGQAVHAHGAADLAAHDRCPFPSTSSITTRTETSSRSGVSPRDASSLPSDIVKQPPCAAASSSSGLVFPSGSAILDASV